MSSFTHAESVTIGAAGSGTIRFPPVPTFQRWQIERVSLTMAAGESNLGGEARVFVNDDIPSNFVDGTNTPWNDVYSGALELGPSDQLMVVYSGCVVGDRATVQLFGTRGPV